MFGGKTRTKRERREQRLDGSGLAGGGATDGLFGYGLRLRDGDPARRNAHTILPDIHGSTLATQSGAHYVSPFLTCGNCNEVRFVNAATVGRALGLVPRGGRTLPPEVLPVCSLCGRTDNWHIGARDMQEEMGLDVEGFKRQLAEEKKAAVQIQRVYRGHLGRRYARRRREERQKQSDLERRSATLIQSTYRRHFAKRKVACIRSLRLIWSAHPSVLSRAVYGWTETEGHIDGRMKCFWWKTDAELRLLKKDYRLLVRRKGNKPPLHLVEANIHEVRRRVGLLLDMFVTRIQKRWRGIMGREFLAVFRRELVRLREVKAAAVYRIQRTYRGWKARDAVAVRHMVRWKRAQGEKYRHGRKLQRAASAQAVRDAKLKAYYLREKREEITAHMTGRCLYKKHAYKESAYADRKLDNIMASYLTARVGQAREAKKEHWAEEQRARTVRAQRGKNFFLAKYFEAEVHERNTKIAERASKQLSPFQTAGFFTKERHKLLEHNKPVPNIRELDPKFIVSRNRK
jgi:hypothetical protein